MNINELVGKKAIRTGPVDLGNGRKDYSYGTEPLLILAVTEHHVVVEYVESFMKGKRHILDSRWNDENWDDYNELMKLADETKEELAKASTDAADHSEPDESANEDNEIESEPKEEIIH